MSQVSIIDITGGHPDIPTQFDANVGSAIPIGNILEIFGDTQVAGNNPVHTVGSGNNITTFVQLAQAIAAPDATAVGLAAFNSAQFTVDADGFVSSIGGTTVGSFQVDDSTAPGTNPVVPDGGGLITVTGGQIPANSTANIIQTNSIAANTYTIQIQRSTAVGVSTVASNGVAHFNSAQFTVDANGFVSATGSVPIQFTGDSGTANPAAGNINLLGSGSITTSAAGSTVTTSLTGLTNHAVLVGAGTSTITKLAVGTNGQVLIGATGADPAFATLTSSDSSITFTPGANTLSLQVTGGTTVGKTITGDSGGALSPTSGNWNILGRSGCKTSGSGSTLTVSGPPYTDQGGSTSVTLNSGSFSTATITLTTPVTAGLLDGDLLQFVATTANALTIQFAATQVGHIGNQASSVAGTFVSTAIGDSLTLRYQASTNDWWATSVIGNWTIT